ncbi:unnamed protein product [Mortierella alpina]
MYRRRVKRPTPPVFGSTLEDMGFSINERSQIVDKSGNPYKFDLKAKDREYQEAHSRALGEVTTAVVLKKLQEELGLTAIKVPFGMDKDDETSPHASILISPDANNASAYWLGVWSRRLMTNNSVDEGSMYSTVKKALKEGYGVVVLNPNAHWWVDGRATVQVPTRRGFKTVPDLESPEMHVDYVLRNLVQASASKEIFFIAQKYGAQALIQALHTQFDAFKDRVSAVATIESSHSIDAFSGSAFRNWWKMNAVNYIQSEVEDKNKVVYRETIGCNCVNAGTHEYDYTIIEMMPSIFQFFKARNDRDNEFERNKDVLLPPNEDDPTTVVITFDEAVEEESPSTATEDDSGWHDTTPVKI